MEAKTTMYHQITFHYLAEFRRWLDETPNIDIVDIRTQGEWGEMEFLITYRLKR